MNRIEFRTERGVTVSVVADAVVLTIQPGNCWAEVIGGNADWGWKVDDDEAARIRRVLNGEDELPADLRLRNAAERRRALQVLCDCVRCELRAPTGLTQAALRDADAALVEAGDAT